MAGTADVDALFAAFLEQSERAEAETFERWVDRHPASAAELRLLHAAWSAVVRELEGDRTDAASSPADRYVRGRELGAGGMGVVYEVHDRELDRTLAMKVLRAGPAAARRARRFLAEARITGRLQHPGIVPVHELGRDAEGRPYFTLAKVEGLTFAAVIEQVQGGASGWTLARVVAHLERVCEAVAFAHDRGVVHRDLKPANLMVGPFGETYVLDWGLARELHRATPEPGGDGSASGDGELATLAGDVLGTPAYMPPEQARGELDAVGPAADVYALGAVLHHLLSGAPPYGAGLAPAATLARVLAGPPPLLGPGVSAELAAIAAKAMAREPAQRYPTALDLAHELRAWLEGRVVTAHASGPWAELRKWIARNRRLSVALGGLALTVVAAVGAVAHFTGLERARGDRLLDLQVLRSLQAELGDLTPEEETILPRLERWLEIAEGLAQRLPWHRETLARLEADPAQDRSAVSQWATLGELVPELTAFVGEDGSLARARERAQWIRAVGERTVTRHAADWERARAAVSGDAHYAGLELLPQVGLVPLGSDPDGGLQAFLHLRSGETPPRAANGAFEVTAQSGCVLLLVPGGVTLLGADADESPPPREGELPRHEVPLAPYLAAKYELTVGQWLRLRDGPRAAVPLERGAYPAAEMDWTQGRAVLRAHGLDLPTEAQWEHLARGGARGPTWWGSDVIRGRELENLDLGAPLPVGSRSPNAFGFYDVLGNLAEWCRNGYYAYPAPGEPSGYVGREGDRAPRPDDPLRALRGGVGFATWSGDLTYALDLSRVSFRSRAGVGDSKPERGLRPVRRLAGVDYGD
jgi:formylglycine-generating enzyme required for sulfatase activity